MRLASSVRTALAAVALVGGTVVGSATPASAATCPHSDSPKIDGGVATWTLKCRKVEGVEMLYIDGWVEDTRSDGLCAAVTIRPENQRYADEVKACGSGRREQIHQSYTGRSATVKLNLRY
ncbi:hypothetical protein [Streptomyces sp. NK08204]|uniref:hypothetical protein n=1 Tax=Streptomyces sp. NK08204 TaxID=2873260 RepID=UPI001CECDCE7|nr:hypothetical protein [Streptomyces sp. NK08204]